jgi:CBS domain-containing protein
MTGNVQTIDDSASLGEVAKLMERHRIKRLPVLRDGELVGIVTRGDLVRALAGFLAPAYEDAINSDREICKAIRSELDRQSWGPCTLVEIAAKDGVVELRGSIFDERERLAIRVAAENVPGVKAVHDHMVWVEPLSSLVMLSPEDSAEPRKG